MLTPSTKERLDQLEARRSDLNISIMQAELIRPKYTKQQIVEWISQFKHGNPNDLNYQKQIIDIFLNSIYVYDDRYIFTYNFHGRTETIPREAVEEAFGSDLTRLTPQSHSIAEWFFCASTQFKSVEFEMIMHTKKETENRPLSPSDPCLLLLTKVVLLF